jgi:uncharacterized membrane protein YfcA
VACGSSGIKIPPVVSLPAYRTRRRKLSTTDLLLLGVLAGTGAGLLAGLIGIGGGIVVVPAVYYGLIHSGFSADVAAHVAVSTSLATILPAAIRSSIAHWQAGNTDIGFCVIGGLGSSWASP